VFGWLSDGRHYGIGNTDRGRELAEVRRFGREAKMVGQGTGRMY